MRVIVTVIVIVIVVVMSCNALSKSIPSRLASEKM